MGLAQPDPALAPLLVHGPWSARYDLGPGHPLTPRRFGPGIDLLRMVAEAELSTLEPSPTSDETLQWIHEAAYVQAVRRSSDAPWGPRERGIGPGDTPAFAGMHEAAAAVAGGSLGAMEAILRGDVGHAFHPGGGLHHAMAGHASGFCVYNDPALAIARARRDGLRVLYIDLDVHHGDGVQAIHRHDPGVMTVSIHQSGRTLFPGTGSVNEVGLGDAAGTVINLPMEPGTGEHAWLAALQRLLPELAASFGPDIVVSQHGADAHAWDPLANLRVTTTAMGAAARLVDAIAHRWAGGRWLATGGGGYDVYRVVPRSWSLVWLAALHRDPDVVVPEAWQRRWADEAKRHGQSPLPERLEDEPNAGLDVDGVQERADRACRLTADLVRELTVPALLRTGTDRGWWDPLAPERGSAGLTEPDPRPGSLDVVSSVDAAAWSMLRLAPGTIQPFEPAAGHALLAGALASQDEVRVSAALADGIVVGAAVSARDVGDGRDRRVLLALGVSPMRRGSGLGAALLQAHLGSLPDTTAWIAEVTLAERDARSPMPRNDRTTLARRLFEGAGFQVQPAAGRILGPDPQALIGFR